MGSTTVNNSDIPRGEFVFILNNFPGIVKIVKMTDPTDGNDSLIRLNIGEKIRINFNSNVSTKLHVYGMQVLLMKIGDLRLFDVGSIIEIN